jgi:RNase P/RNase MRP subunit POP5
MQRMNNPDNKSKAKAKPAAARLKPSERDKERYVAYEIASAGQLARDADRQLVEQMRMLLGIFMAPKANVTSMKYNPEKQRGVLRINRKFVDCMRTCFAMIKKLNGQEVQINTIKTSGMIHKVKDYIYQE